MIETASPGRRRSVRIVLAVLIGFVFLVSEAVVQTLAATFVSDTWFVRYAFGGIGPFLVALPLAPLVAYRRSTTLIFLFAGFPFAYPFVAPRLFPFIWRLAGLPHRDWPPLSEDSDDDPDNDDDDE